MGDLTSNFSRSEFACKCGCDFDLIDLTFVRRLQFLRNACDFPFPITSGCRCLKHNKKEGGKDDSAHLIGKAGDVGYANSHQLYLLLKYAIALGFRRIGIAREFIHLDIDGEKPQEVVWLY